MLVDSGADVNAKHGNDDTAAADGDGDGDDDDDDNVDDNDDDDDCYYCVGADIRARNLKDHDVVFMAVLYGHSSKGTVQFDDCMLC